MRYLILPFQQSPEKMSHVVGYVRNGPISLFNVVQLCGKDNVQATVVNNLSVYNLQVITI